MWRTFLIFLKDDKEKKEKPWHKWIILRLLYYLVNVYTIKLYWNCTSHCIPLLHAIIHYGMWQDDEALWGLYNICLRMFPSCQPPRGGQGKRKLKVLRVALPAQHDPPQGNHRPSGPGESLCCVFFPKARTSTYTSAQQVHYFEKDTLKNRHTKVKKPTKSNSSLHTNCQRYF